MSAKLREYWWAPPLVSGILLALSFYPFNFWPLAFIALAPLYYVALTERSGARAFWAGAITAALFSFSLAYFTVIGFHWLPEAYIFAWAVKLSVVPIVLCSAAMVGFVMWALNKLRARSLFLTMLLCAALYAAPELLLRAVFGGYYLGTLAYAASSLPLLMSLAALGGVPLVSFCVAWVSGAIAEGVRAYAEKELAAWAGAVALSILILIALGLPNWLYVRAPLNPLRALSVAVIQMGQRAAAQFGSDASGSFSFPALSAQLQAASAGAPDLIIYPFSPVEGALYRGKKEIFDKNILVASEAGFGAWLKAQVPASSTVLVWDNLYADEKFYNEYELLQGGILQSEYRKRALFPFMDYTPQWAQRVGLFTTPFDEVAGAPGNRATLGGMPLGSLLCSELDQPDLARGEAAYAPLIIAVGSEAMFDSPVASEFSLKAAQFRAAENNVPVIRGNILGPSAVVARDGSIIVRLNAGEVGIMRAGLQLGEPRPTAFSRFGDVPVFSLLCLIVGAALWAKKKAAQ